MSGYRFKNVGEGMHRSKKNLDSLLEILSCSQSTNVQFGSILLERVQSLFEVWQVADSKGKSKHKPRSSHKSQSYQIIVRKVGED